MRILIGIALIFTLTFFALSCGDDDELIPLSGTWEGAFFYPTWNSGTVKPCTAIITQLKDNTISGLATIGGIENVIVKGELSNTSVFMLACDSGDTNDYARITGKLSGKVIAGEFVSYGLWAWGGDGTFALTNTSGVK